MKRFGLKGKSVGIEVILAIIVLLLILCMGFGYCLRFTHREGADMAADMSEQSASAGLAGIGRLAYASSVAGKHNMDTSHTFRKTKLGPTPGKWWMWEKKQQQQQQQPQIEYKMEMDNMDNAHTLEDPIPDMTLGKWWM